MQPDIYNGDTTPKVGDSRNTLYKKILGAVQNVFSGLSHNNPAEGDTNRQVLVKILRIFNGT